MGAKNREQMERGIANSLPILLIFLNLISAEGLSRSDFPPEFVFGASTSAYQVEGVVNEDGRGVSVWDTFSHSGGTRDGSNGDVTADGYHHYKEDVKLMSEIGLEGYRFSISWPRIIPNGRGAVNKKGIEFYNNLIDELISHGIQPHVTLFHYDLPQVLEDEYGGWLSPKIIDDFVAFADICFNEFGDRVLHWTTFNEPNILSIGAYSEGIFPPKRCSQPFGFVNCTAGDSTTEPYLVLHNFLLAHASVAELYRTKYKEIQNGFIGINIYAFQFYPKTNSAADIAAAQRAIDFWCGWVLHPVIFGDYQETLKERVRSRLPHFTKDQSRFLKGTIDFIGINYYSSLYVSVIAEKSQLDAEDFFGDMGVQISVSKDSTAGEEFNPEFLPVDPDGLESLLLALASRYGNLPIFVHEHGIGTSYNKTVDDPERVDVIRRSTQNVLSAIRGGSNCKGYFVWSFLDVFEIITGFITRYGLYYVDFEDKSRKRQPKLSALWYKDFLKKPVSLASL
ncbi:beta-glucosidase 22-like [Wolffia australiana]